ncbi:hypothetical protein [uncultured Paludibaculum sp.]|uniref:hypothetical protein n=1 Tax=uncultured Paludibaculum sp. TaxID=1765020 RepID=UPI002AAC0007|nr:hypothetical protein [uncultured Paludibaculum sp.]
MSLIRVFYKTAKVFSDLRENAWILPLIAFVVSSFLVSSLIVGLVGWGPITDTARQLDSRASQIGTEKLQIFILLGAAAKTALLVVAVAFAALAIHLLIWGAIARASYCKILAVCLYAAYMRSAVDLVIILTSATYCWLFGLPVTVYNADRINIGMLISEPVSRGRIYEAAKTLDILMIGALIITAFGLSKAVPRFLFQNAAILVFALWVAWALVSTKLPAPR